MGTALNILITGSNRGIGKALLANYLQRPGHIIIAGLRDPSPKSCDDLRTLPCGKGSKLIFLKIDSGSETDAVTAIQHLKDSYGITRLDLVIANAGISNYFGKAVVTPAAQMIEHFKINCVGPLLLFQATAALLAEAANPKFVIMSSGAASIGNMGDLKIDNTAYGTSKAAANFVARKIHFENPEITAFPINPGWLQTELGNHAAGTVGQQTAPTTLSDGIKAVVSCIDSATRQLTSGRFINAAGGELSW